MVKNEYNAVFNIKNIEFYEKNFKRITETYWQLTDNFYISNIHF